MNSILTGLFVVLQSEVALQHFRMEGEPEGRASEADFPEHLGVRACSSILTSPLRFFLIGEECPQESKVLSFASEQCFLIQVKPRELWMLSLLCAGGLFPHGFSGRK